MNWIIIIELLYILTALAVCIKILFDTESSVKASAYVLLVLAVPVAGMAIYLTIGLNYRKKGIYSKKLNLDQAQAKAVLKKVNLLKEENALLFNQKHLKYKGLGEMLFADNQSLLTPKNKVQLLINGEEKFPSLLNSLKQARHHIHIEYYIFENDSIGNEIADILIEKARQGVQVRFIYDDFGSRGIRKNIVKRLQNNGVEAFPFYKVILVKLANRLNYRNHRKIVIIDGETAFVGGINISDRYKNQAPDKLYWRDTHLKITGQAVVPLQRIFFADWNFCSGRPLQVSHHYFIDTKSFGDLKEQTWVQIAVSGPDSPIPSILYAYLQAIHIAQKELLITTPYFIPAREFTVALNMAVLRGVDVKLLVPGISDSLMVNAASKSHYLELLQMGVKIYRYEKGFVHAKTVVCDSEFCMVGTANIDHRSFDLNFEVNALVYDKKVATDLKKNFDTDITNARQLHLNDWKNRSFRVQLSEKLLRLIAPLL